MSHTLPRIFGSKVPHELRIFLLIATCASCAQVGPAARAAALAPATWIPVAGAALIAATGTDREISDWAREHTPVYGSAASAASASDTIRSIAQTEAILLEGWHLWTARDADPATWIGPPIAALGSAIADEYAVRGLKRATDRTRPSGADALSFPSSHAAGTAGRAFAASEIVRRDLGHLTLAPAWIAANHGLVALGSWARVEAGAHYPTDVLIGAALGHFLSHFAHGLIPTTSAGALEAWAGPGASGLAWTIPFGGARPAPRAHRRLSP